jgi:hypothetical protein
MRARWEARVFQHELDHLNGVMFTERAVMRSLAHQSVLVSEEVKVRLLLEAEAMEEVDDGDVGTHP